MPAQTHHPKLLSINQVAGAMNVSTRTVRRLIKHHGLHHHRMGRGKKQFIRVSEEDLRAYLNSTRQ
jgi:excisionase family DNA binding protein